MPRKSESTEAEKISALPEWARIIVTKATADRDYWRGKAFQSANIKNTDTTLICHYGGNIAGLPVGQIVSFKVDGGEIECRVKNGKVYVYGRNSFLVVRPESSNTLTLGIDTGA